MPAGIGNFGGNRPDPRKAAIEAAKRKAEAAKPEDAKMVIYKAPSECADRIRIEFDDSGSMGGYIKDAKNGVVEFLKNCIPNQTAVAIHFMNTKEWNTILRSDLPVLAQDVLEASLQSGGTPFFNTMKKMLEATPRATRLVVFTDGSPTDELNAESNDELRPKYGWDSSFAAWKSSADIIIRISKSQAPAISIDTVFFGEAHKEFERDEIKLLKYLSEQTGGFFLHFDPQKMDFAKGLKYLAPVNRLRLTDGAFRAAIEKGEVK